MTALALEANQLSIAFGGLKAVCDLTVNVPPRVWTFTGESRSLREMPATTAAQAPVPQASVSPAPRSCTRSRMWRRSITCT